MANEPSSEAWKKIVLRSMTPPAWLRTDSPDGDVVVSSRFRAARNISQFKFPHIASNDELRSVFKIIKNSAETSSIQLDIMQNISEAERDYLLGSRLISADFLHRETGRAVLLDPTRTVSIMVNEEDHIRIQALTAGWSIWDAEDSGRQTMEHLESNIDFMFHPHFGPLTASPTNLNGGQRRSALFHLIGLAHTKRLKRLIKTLSHLDLVCRGLFGEASLAIGAFVQISATKGNVADFRGACNQVIAEERLARSEVDQNEISEKAQQAAEYAIRQNEITMRDALLVLGWIRWANERELPGFRTEPRMVDYWSSTMEVHGTQDQKIASRHRAEFLRTRLEGLD